MLFHYVFRVQQIVPAVYNSLVFEVPGLPDRLIGEIPVYVFFMISGFVISFTLDRTRTWRDFVVSRFSRLYPVYWAVTLLMAAVWTAAAAQPWQTSLGVVLVNLTMVQDYVRVGSINAVYWSLTAELGFYALMLALFVAGEFGRLLRWAAAWLVVSIVFGQACNVFGEHNVPVPTVAATFFNLFLAPYFAAGIAFYRISREGWSKFSVGILLLCVLGYFVMPPPVGAGIMLMFTLLWCAIVARHAGVLALRPPVFLGAISYALYLSHLILGMHVIAALDGVPMIARVAAACGASMVLASILTFAVERPAQAFIRRNYRESRPAAVSASP